MKVIGLCGGSGSGKGLVCDIFRELGINSIDTDKIYHDLISTDSECTRELVSCFGEQIYQNPGIDRKKLREFVFSSKDNLVLLNRITHKHIIANVQCLIETIKRDRNPLGIIVDAPVLFESGFDKKCDLTVCVIADEQIRIDRIVRRDGISEEAARARINSQLSNDELIKKCTYYIENNSTRQKLFEKIVALKRTIFDNKV